MDDSKSNPENEDKERFIFVDASDEFPFYESPFSSSSSPTSSLIYQNNDLLSQNSLQPNPSNNNHSQTGPCIRRRWLSHRFRDESGIDCDPKSSLSFNYSLNKDRIKRVDQKLVVGNEDCDFPVVTDSEDPDNNSFVGFEKKKRFNKKVEDLVDGNENDTSNLVSNSVDTEIRDDLAIGSEDPGNSSFAGSEREKIFNKKVEDLADENDNLNLVSNSIDTEIRDESAVGSDDTAKISFVGFDHTESVEREKIFGMKDDKKGVGINLKTDVNDGNFDLLGSESSSNLVTNIVNAEIKDSNIPSVGFDTVSAERKRRFAKRLEELKKRKENSKLQIGNILNEEDRDDAVDDCVNDDELVINENSSGFLFGLASLVMKVIGLQLSLLVIFVTFPMKFLYFAYMFVVDPFQVARRATEFTRSILYKSIGFVSENFVSFVGEWLKDHKTIWQLVLQFGWGFLWSAYVCIILVSLLISAFLFSGVIIRKLVDEPFHMKEALIFDYTKNSPVAFVPITSCPVELQNVLFSEKSDVGQAAITRIIPRNHKLQATVSLVLPESDYNRNLGMFQVRVDLLSASGKTLANSKHSSILHFKSQPIRILLTFFKIAPLITGYSSESQTLSIKLGGLIEGDTPTACLKVVIEQRAEFRPGAGIPEIYDANLIFESELPMLKRLIFLWKKTLFIWLGLCLFTTELLFALVCCRPLILPRGGVRNIAPQDNLPAQR